MQAEKGKKYTFAEFELDVQKRRFLSSGKPVSLHAKAFDLLVFLAENAGRPISKEEILESVWKDQFVEESNLTVQISAIRKAMKDRTARPRFLATIPGKGYQFIAEVADLSEAPAERTVDPEQIPTGAQGEAVHSKKAGSRFAVFALGIALVLLFAGIYSFQNLWRSSPPLRSLAVLPFVNETGDSASDFLADGLAESVIFSLSRVSELKVLSRDSSFKFRDSATDARIIGRDLNVGGVLSGRIVLIDNNLIVRTELISTEDNSVLWGEQFSRRMEDIELLQIDIAKAIARELRLTLSKGNETQLAKVQTDDHEAFQLYLTGRYHLSRFTDDGFQKARENFRSAIEKDPGYALAHVGLAESYNLLSGWGAIAPNDGFPLAKAAAVKALEIDPELAEAHTQLAIVQMFYDLNWTGAENELAKAVALNPSHSESHHMTSMFFMFRGKFNEARAAAQRAIVLDPLSLPLKIALGNISIYERRFDEAQREFKKALELDPNSGLGRWSLGNAYLHDRKFAEAIGEFESAIRLSGDSPDEPASLAYAFALTGKRDEAIKILNDLEQRSNGGYVSRGLIATIHGALGDADKAFENLERAVRERDAMLPYLMFDPYFDPIRDDTRFEELVRRLGLL